MYQLEGCLALEKNRYKTSDVAIKTRVASVISNSLKFPLPCSDKLYKLKILHVEVNQHPVCLRYRLTWLWETYTGWWSPHFSISLLRRHPTSNSLRHFYCSGVTHSRHLCPLSDVRPITGNRTIAGHLQFDYSLQIMAAVSIHVAEQSVVVHWDR